MTNSKQGLYRSPDIVLLRPRHGRETRYVLCQIGRAIYITDSWRQTCSIRRVCPQTLTDMNYPKDLRKKGYTLRNFHVRDILPFVHRYKPPVSSTTATIYKN